MSDAKGVSDALQDEINKLKRSLALDLDQRIVLKTPVDTGRARANWLVGLGSPVRESRVAVDQAGGNTIAEGAATIAKAEDEDIWISNNLSYIVDLENGTSKQAPAGMVRLSIMETESVFRGR